MAAYLPPPLKPASFPPPPNSPPEKGLPPCPSTYFVRDFLAAKKEGNLSKMKEMVPLFGQFSKFTVTSFSEFEAVFQHGVNVSRVFIHQSTPVSHVFYIRHVIKEKKKSINMPVFFLDKDDEFEMLQTRLNEAEDEAMKAIVGIRKAADTDWESHKDLEKKKRKLDN